MLHITYMSNVVHVFIKIVHTKPLTRICRLVTGALSSHTPLRVWWRGSNVSQVVDENSESSNYRGRLIGEEGMQQFTSFLVSTMLATLRPKTCALKRCSITYRARCSSSNAQPDDCTLTNKEPPYQRKKPPFQAVHALLLPQSLLLSILMTSSHLKSLSSSRSQCKNGHNAFALESSKRAC